MPDPDLPHVHPDSGVPTLIVTGQISPMTMETIHPSLRVGRGAGYAKGKGIVDLQMARDIASRRVGPAADAEVGRALLTLAAVGGVVVALAKASLEIQALAEGVLSGDPSPMAMEVARRMSSSKELALASGDQGLMELIFLSYATLQLDETRLVVGGAS